VCGSFLEDSGGDDDDYDDSGGNRGLCRVGPFKKSGEAFGDAIKCLAASMTAETSTSSGTSSLKINFSGQ